MVAVPAAIVFVNSDVALQVRTWAAHQLHIDEVISGAEFDSRVAADGYYVDKVHQFNLRLMVHRPFTDLTNRQLADLVLFIRDGLAYVEQNKFGPPGASFQVLLLHWGQFGVY